MRRATLPLLASLVFICGGLAAEGTVAVDLSGSLDLRPGAPLFHHPELSRHEATAHLRNAMRSPESTVFLDLSGFSGSLATAEELATTLRAERTANPGKKVIALIDGADNATLILAAAVDEVVMPEAGLLSVSGLNLESYYFADALAKAGVRFHAVASGEHKTAHEPFTRNAPSATGAQELRDLANDLDQEITALSAKPGLSVQDILAIRAKSPQTSVIAKAGNLVDVVAEPGAWRNALPQPMRWMGEVESGKNSPKDLAGLLHLIQTLLGGDAPAHHPKAVAVVDLAGEDNANLIDDLAEDDHIIAVVLRIDSPGGSASASDRIHHAVRRLKAKKPVVALFDQVAASGGYYIGCAADEILVHRTTITGSIGVFALVPDGSATLDLLGIKRFAVSTGPRADLESLTAPFTPERQAALQQVISDVDARFLGLVAETRKLSLERVKELAGGRVYTGPQAVANGLADGFGTLGTAVASARHRAGEDDPLPVERYPEHKGLLQRLGLGGVHVLAGELLPEGLARQGQRLQRLTHQRTLVVQAWANVPDAMR